MNKPKNKRRKELSQSNKNSYKKPQVYEKPMMQEDGEVAFTAAMVCLFACCGS